jgi:hypothetical protein
LDQSPGGLIGELDWVKRELHRAPA